MWGMMSWSVFYGYWKSPGLDPAVSRGINRQEVSGPIITVYTCDDVDAALHEASSLPPALQTAAFTKDPDLTPAMPAGLRFWRNGRNECSCLKGIRVNIQ